MKPNPLLRRLGFSDTDRVAVIHADDIGMCQASLTAFADLLDVGLVSSGAVMVPCPWFPSAAAWCRQHPAADVGVHLCLTSEWDAYRWGPLSTRDPASGLLDREGYFHRRSESVQELAGTEAVEAELMAQVDRALTAGIDLTHVDTHMGTVAHPKFVGAYIQAARRANVPPMLPRLDEQGWQKVGLNAETAAFAAGFVRVLEEQGSLLCDQIAGLPLLEQPGDRIAAARQALDALPAGLTHFIIHPSADTPELRAITTTWRSRVADYQAFASQELRSHLRKTGIQVIGYRLVRDMMRS